MAEKNYSAFVRDYSILPPYGDAESLVAAAGMDSVKNAIAEPRKRQLVLTTLGKITAAVAPGTSAYTPYFVAECPMRIWKVGIQKGATDGAITDIDVDMLLTRVGAAEGSVLDAVEAIEAIAVGDIVTVAPESTAAAFYNLAAGDKVRFKVTAIGANDLLSGDVQFTLNMSEL